MIWRGAHNLIRRKYIILLPAESSLRLRREWRCYYKYVFGSQSISRAHFFINPGSPQGFGYPGNPSFWKPGNGLAVELVWPKVPWCFIVFFAHHSGSAKSLQSVRCPTHKNFLRWVRLSRKGVRRSNNQESKSEWLSKVTFFRTLDVRLSGYCRSHVVIRSTIVILGVTTWVVTYINVRLLTDSGIIESLVPRWEECSK